MLDLLGWEPTAEFSPCTEHADCPPSCEHRPYRYTLTRRWEEGPAMLVVALNPSTATETEDDPTVTRMIGFAKREGLAGLTVANLFAFRATDPKDMKAVPDPVGPENDEWLRRLALEHPLRVAAWGVHGDFRGRAADVLDRDLLGPLRRFGKPTKDGHPRHPLYLSKVTPLVSLIS